MEQVLSDSLLERARVIPGAVHGGAPFFDAARLAQIKEFLDDALRGER